MRGRSHLHRRLYLSWGVQERYWSFRSSPRPYYTPSHDLLHRKVISARPPTKRSSVERPINQNNVQCNDDNYHLTWKTNHNVKRRKVFLENSKGLTNCAVHFALSLTSQECAPVVYQGLQVFICLTWILEKPFLFGYCESRGPTILCDSVFP